MSDLYTYAFNLTFLDRGSIRRELRYLKREHPGFDWFEDSGWFSSDFEISGPYEPVQRISRMVRSIPGNH